MTQAAAEIIPKLVEGESNYVVSTDQGNEFQGLEEVPEPAVHRHKRPEDRNALAVVDRAIQTLKRDLAGKVARDAGGWAEHVEGATEAYNKEAVHAAPEDVEKQPATTFRVYQDNARKFQHNRELTEGRQRRLAEAGAFRAPTNAQRSFQPQYGPVKQLAGYDSMTVRATDGTEGLLKHVQPVPKASGEPVQRLTQPGVPLAARQLRDFNPAPKAPPAPPPPLPPPLPPPAPGLAAPGRRGEEAAPGRAAAARLQRPAAAQGASGAQLARTRGIRAKTAQQIGFLTS